jgi:hypothetical protein
MRHTSCHHLPQLEGRVETFLLQLLDLLPDRGLDLVLFDIDRSGGPARDELVYVDDDEPGSVSLREALAYGSACAAALEPSRPDDHLEHCYLPSVRLLARTWCGQMSR